jgi:hypothetical protein
MMRAKFIPLAETPTMPSVAGCSSLSILSIGRGSGRSMGGPISQRAAAIVS